MSEVEGQVVTPSVEGEQSTSTEDLSKALTQPLPKDLLLVVFIHG